MVIDLATAAPSRIQLFLQLLKQPHVLELLLLGLAVIVALPPAIIAMGEVGRWWRRRSAEEALACKGLDRALLDELQEYYVRPDCQTTDPGEGADLIAEVPCRSGLIKWLGEVLANPFVLPCWSPFGPNAVVNVTGPDRQDLFRYTDELIRNRPFPKFTLLLADTGMGKTSFLLNYFAYHLRKKSRRESADLDYLSLEDPEIIKRIEQKAEAIQHRKVVLLLDGLDEDIGASGKPGERLLEIVRASRDFHRVLVTSRTQLFGRDEEVPSDSGVPVSPLEAPNIRHNTHRIQKLYVSPFSLWQIDAYLRRRFRRRKDVKSARDAVKKIEDLQARPLLLSNIEAVFSEKGEIDRSSQVYELLIDKWIDWDASRLSDPKGLRDFLECLAVELYTRWANEQGAKISDSELPDVANRFGVALPSSDDICVRSLLNRDAGKNLKFAHRSIMEYLFVARFRKFPDATQRLACQAGSETMVPWSPEMKRFYIYHLFDIWGATKEAIKHYEGADLYGLEDMKLNPFTSVRSMAMTMTGPDMDEDRLSQSLREMAGSDRFPHLYLEVRSPATARMAAHHPIWEVARRAARSEHLGTRFLPDPSPVVDEVLRNLSAAAVLIIDYGLGLVWETPGSHLHVSHELAQARAASLSEAQYAGFSDWRLPTLEEVSSLVCLLREDHPSAFDKLGMKIWTADKAGLVGLSVELDTCRAAFYNTHFGDARAPRAVCVASLAARSYRGGSSAKLAA